MKRKGQLNGMRGVYLVAAELCRLGLIVSPTSRSARGVDLLSTSDDFKKVFSIEVKTTTTNRFWQLASHAKTLASESLYYIFVRVRANSEGEEEISYYPVSSLVVKKKSMRPDPSKSEDKQYRAGFTLWEKDIEKYKNDWSVFA